MDVFGDPRAKLRHPFTALVAGPTGGGKTVLVRRLLKNHRYTFAGFPPFIKVLWCYGQWQDLYKQPIGATVKVEYHEGLASEDVTKEKECHIVVVDDLMNELGSKQELANLFTKGSHHLKVSVFFIVQNLFLQAKYMRSISLNAHYIFLLKNPRDKLQIATLGRQLYPEDPKILLDSYHKATKSQYGYLCIDLKGDTPEHLRLRTRLLPEETPPHLRKYIVAPIVYVAK